MKLDVYADFARERELKCNGTKHRLDDVEILRAGFEAWIKNPPFERLVQRYPNDETKHAWPGQYRSYDLQLAWLAWQEAWIVSRLYLQNAEADRLPEAKL